MPATKRRRDSSSEQTGQRALRIIALLILVVIFAIGGLGLGSPKTGLTTTDSAAAPTVGAGSPTALVFPTVEPSGSAVTLDRTYFHSSALFSLAHPAGWDLAPNGEERVDPVQQNVKLARAGATFINGSLLSVIHVFVEKDPDRAAKVLADLDKYYDKANLDAAWSNFTGGWQETGRRTSGDQFVVDFKLALNGNTYLGRQISHFDNDWLMVSRLVVPDNNPALLDRLQQIIWSAFTFYPAMAASPISWSSTADPALGYVIKYPADWVRVQGDLGSPIVVSGNLQANAFTLTTRAEPGKAAKTEADARAWITVLRPKAQVLSSKPETRGDAAGFSLSYNDPDPDGNARSAIVTLLNGANGSLYSANFLSNARGVDLLTDVKAPPELTQIRSTFTLFATARFVPTLTPTNTPPPTATLPITSTPIITATAAAATAAATTAAATTIATTTITPTSSAPAF